MSAGARRALGADELYNEQHDSESQRPRLATGLRLRAPGGLVPCMKPNRTQSSPSICLGRQPSAP
jgi:hypothetical protein